MLFSKLNLATCQSKGFSMQAPNPSIERTLPGKPISASHVKR